MPVSQTEVTLTFVLSVELGLVYCYRPKTKIVSCFGRLGGAVWHNLPLFISNSGDGVGLPPVINLRPMFTLHGLLTHRGV